MKYNVIDLIKPTLTNEELKNIINKKLLNCIMFMEMSLNKNE